MSLLGDFYKKAKKKLQDWEKPIQKSVSSDLSSAYKGAKNYLGNDASVGGMVKNTVLGIPKATRTVFDATRRGNLGKTISDNLEQFDYFKPTEKVRVRDHIRELPSTIEKVGKDVVRDTARFGISVKELPETFRTGHATKKFYNTPLGRINSFQSEGQNRMERGDGFLKSTLNPALDTVLAGSDIGSIAKPALNSLKSISKSNPVKKEIANIANDLIQPVSKKIKVPGYRIIKKEKVDGIFAPGGIQQTRILAEPKKIKIEMDKTVANPFQSKLLKSLSNPGLTIKSTGEGFDARIVAKNKKAKETVQSQKNNQKAGLPKAEPGFVAPKNIMTPVPKEKVVGPTESYLAQEARKYNSVDDFIEANLNKISPKFGRFPDLGDIIKSPKLFNKFPEFKNITIHLDFSGYGSVANAFNTKDPKKSFISISTQEFLDPVFKKGSEKRHSDIIGWKVKNGKQDSLASSLMHEIEHIKQIRFPHKTSNKNMPTFKDVDIVKEFDVSGIEKNIARGKDWMESLSEKEAFRREKTFRNIEQLTEIWNKANKNQKATHIMDSPSIQPQNKSVGRELIPTKVGIDDYVTPTSPSAPTFNANIPYPKKLSNGSRLPNIEEYVNTKTGEITTTKTDGSVPFAKKISPKRMSVEEYVNGKPADDLNPTYNKYQERAFNEKWERIEEMDALLNYPAKLRSIGFKKNEIDKIGKEQASIILKLAGLGFPKKAMPDDLLSDRVKRIIQNKVSWRQLQDYYARKKALDTHFLDGVDPKTLEDINPVMVGGRDVYRNFEAVFGKNYPTIKRNLLDPFDIAKGEMFKEQEILANEVFENIVKKLGIKKGSALDKAVVEFGEGKISIDQLHRDFLNDWEKIVKADQWFRNKYPQLLHDLNEVREANFPTHPLYPESSKIIPQRKDYYRHGKDLEGFAGLNNMFESAAAIDPALAATSDVTNPKSKWLSFAQKRKSDENDFGAVEGYLDYIKNHSYAKHIDPFIQKFKGVDDEAKDMLPRGAFLEDSERIGLAEELSKKMDPVQQITESLDPEHIRQILIDKGVSESQSDWMSKELATITNYEKTKSFLKNKLAKNTGKQFENLTSASSLAESGQNKENNFLVFIKNFSRDLAGKTNPIDRPFQENLFGRKTLNILNWANSRFKANAVLGNASSSLAQFFNIPQGFASAGVRNSAKGLADSLADIFRTKSPINNSAFVRERYFNSLDKFDEGVLNNTKKFAVWMTGIGDKVGTRFIWNSHYRKALAEGVSNPVKYADDWTRKMVAGRGIGEVPIAQKSKVVQMIAPFQLEVANQWYALRDMAKNDPRKLVVAKKMIEFSVASYLMNQIVKEIRGSDVSFDPINAMVEAYQEFEEDGGLGGATKALGRVVGEGVSNLPGGQYLASAYPEYGWGINKENHPTLAKVLNNPRKDFFGEGDPTRFGTGGLPMYSALKNPLTGIVTPYGGKQLEKMYSGVKSLWNGHVENNAGKIMTPVERSIPNVTKGVLFGKNAFGEMQDYFDNERTPLSDLQTEKYKLMGNDKGYFEKVMLERKADNERESYKTGKNVAEAKGLSDDLVQLSNGNIYSKSLNQEFKNERVAQFAIDKEDFMNSEDKYRERDGEFWYKQDGEFRSKTAAARNKDLSKARTNLEMDRAQASGDLQAWAEAADKKIEAINTYMLTLDPAIDQDEIDSLTLEKENLLDKAEKYAEYGGFKKGSKGKKLEEKYRYPLVDPEFIRINALISGMGRNRQFRMERRALPLIVRRLPVVHRTKRR